MSTRKKFLYRGYTLEELQNMDLDQLADIMPSRIRRTLRRGLSPEHQKLLKKIIKAKSTGKVVRTHLRDMPILPQMVGAKVGVYNGKEFVQIEIKPQMIGHYLGEFAPTHKLAEYTAEKK